VRTVRNRRLHARAGLAALVLAACLAGTSTAPAAPRAATATCPGVIIPMYGGYASNWRRLTASPPRAAIAIANLGNGPGQERYPAWADIFARAQAAGVRVVGYVYTRFGTRSRAQVERDVDRWERWYPVDGIFVDNGTANPSKVPYYSALLGHIRSQPRNFTVMNGGVIRDYMPLTDVVVSYEGDLPNFARHVEPDWISSLPAAKFGTIVHGVRSESAMRSVLDTARQRNLGTIYVTDARFPTPYFSLSSFLGAQETYLRRNRGCGIQMKR
jgi:spherulation-specific family 4 protein